MIDLAKESITRKFGDDSNMSRFDDEEQKRKNQI